MAITELCECHLLSLFPSFSSKLRREELEQLRRELDQLKTRLSESLSHTHTHTDSLHSFSETAHVLFHCWSTKEKQEPSCLEHLLFLLPLTGRQEEDMFLQQAQARETRRLYEHSCKVHIVTHSQCFVGLWFWFFQMLNLSLWDLFRLWRSWQTATEFTTLIWQRQSYSILTHSKRFARSGICVTMYSLCVSSFFFFLSCTTYVTINHLHQINCVRTEGWGQKSRFPRMWTNITSAFSPHIE